DRRGHRPLGRCQRARMVGHLRRVSARQGRQGVSRTPRRGAPGRVTGRAQSARWYRATVIGAVAAGIALRVWLLRGPTGALDSDEAIVGLMARHIVHQHQFTTFYWGQHYGGSLTAVVMA